MPNIFNKKHLHIPNLSIINSIREVGRNPFVDWAIVLIISVLLTIFLFIVSFFLYREIMSGNIKSTDTITTSTVEKFNQKDLSSMIERFDAKNEISTQAKRGYSGPSDPSL